jgi:hypothetical protein
MKKIEGLKMTSKATPLDELIDKNGDFSFTENIFGDYSCHPLPDATKERVEQAFKIDVIDESLSKERVRICITPNGGGEDKMLILEVNMKQGAQTNRVTVNAGALGQEIHTWTVGHF